MGSHISLFAGVGMTDIATEKFGFNTIATAEIDPWNRSVLQKRFPHARHFSDVRHVRANNPHWPHTGDVVRPLLVSGGFPCQDVSALGAGTGLNGSRSGLWSEFARVIREFEPEYVLIENSPVLRSRGLAAVLFDLWSMGYDARWDCIPAAAVGAPHLRDRVFVVAWKHPEYDDNLDAPSGRPFGMMTLRTGLIDRHANAITKLPRAGELFGGVTYAATPQYPLKGLRASAKFPTPRRAPNEWRTTRNAPTHGNGHGKTLAGELNDLERAAGRVPAPSSESAGNVNPDWVEWLMGLPIGWTNPDLAFPFGPVDWAREPEPWLIPRTLADAPHRRARLSALGNGLVWLCALRALEMIPDLKGTAL